MNEKNPFWTVTYIFANRELYQAYPNAVNEPRLLDIVFRLPEVPTPSLIRYSEKHYVSGMCRHIRMYVRSAA